MSEAYGPLVRRLFADPPGAGRLEGPDVRHGRAGDRVRDGAEVAFSLRVRDGVVAEARFQAFGCPHTIAAAALVAAGLPGEALAAVDCDPHALARRLDVPAEKLGRLLIVEDALAACLGRDGDAARVLS